MTEGLDWRRVFRELRYRDVGRPQQCVLRNKAGEERARAAVGWPEHQIVIQFEGEDHKAFAKAGWAVIPFPLQSYVASLPFLKFLDDVAYTMMLRHSRATAKMTTSEAEQKMLRALIETAGLPVPDRNLRFFDDDGNYVGTPDFAWPDRKVIVEVDGWWFHGGAALREKVMRAAAADSDVAKRVDAHERDRAAHDAFKRRVMQSQGWTVLVVADTELQTEAGMAKVAAQVKAVWASRQPGTQPGLTTAG